MKSYIWWKSKIGKILMTMIPICAASNRTINHLINKVIKQAWNLPIELIFFVPSSNTLSIASLLCHNFSTRALSIMREFGNGQFPSYPMLLWGWLGQTGYQISAICHYSHTCLPLFITTFVTIRRQSLKKKAQPATDFLIWAKLPSITLQSKNM